MGGRTGVGGQGQGLVCRHVVCLFTTDFTTPGTSRVLAEPGDPVPVPQEEDVGCALFLAEINRSLQAMGVQQLSSFLSHVVPLLNKVLSRYGLAVASCERKACQAPAQPYLDQQDYLLVGVSATSY